MIISVSRRTDIPAFYSQWFMKRIRAGFVLSRNPFNARQVKHVSLLPEDVDALVFWTRNGKPLSRYFPELDRLGFNYYFHYTITGYPKQLEPSVPALQQAIETFSSISSLIGPARIIWRYDPILVCNLVDFNQHRRLFAKISSKLAGRTRRVVISFADFYQKTRRNLARVDGLTYSDLPQDNEALYEIAHYMADTAAQFDMEIHSCAEAIDLTACGIQPGKCIDNQLLNRLFGLSLAGKKDPGQRAACTCIKSQDIGQYNSCSHGCRYCYATFSDKIIAKNKKSHQATSPFLIGNSQ
jgi:DNA repair photolyase